MTDFVLKCLLRATEERGCTPFEFAGHNHEISIKLPGFCSNKRKTQHVLLALSSSSSTFAIPGSIAEGSRTSLFGSSTCVAVFSPISARRTTVEPRERTVDGASAASASGTRLDLLQSARSKRRRQFNSR